MDVPVIPITTQSKATLEGGGGTNPDPALLELMRSIRAVEVRPKEVAREKGMANHQTPPSKYPLAVLSGLAAMADCQ